MNLCCSRNILMCPQINIRGIDWRCYYCADSVLAAGSADIGMGIGISIADIGIGVGSGDIGIS